MSARRTPSVLSQGQQFTPTVGQNPPDEPYLGPVSGLLFGGGGDQFQQPILETQHHLPPPVEDGLPGNGVPGLVPENPLSRSRRLAAGDPIPGEVTVDIFRCRKSVFGEVHLAKAMAGPLVVRGLEEQ